MAVTGGVLALAFQCGHWKKRTQIQHFQKLIRVQREKAEQLGDERRALEYQQHELLLRVAQIENEIQIASLEKRREEEEIMDNAAEDVKVEADLLQKSTQKQQALSEIDRIKSRRNQMKKKFLEQKRRWEEMKTRYHEKLLEGLEELSGMVLDRILQRLQAAVLEHAGNQIEILRNEKLNVESIQSRLPQK